MKGAKIVRLRMNIKDLLLAKVPCLTKHGKPAATVSFSKHLCGAATDLTLACLSRYQKDLQMSFYDKNQVIQGTDGILIALCCHHRCTFDSYINMDYLQGLGIDKFEFDCMSRMSSWAKERRGICKRLLNKGRLEHLRQEGFCPGLIEFIELESSLETIAIWTRRN